MLLPSQISTEVKITSNVYVDLNSLEVVPNFRTLPNRVPGNKGKQQDVIMSEKNDLSLFQGLTAI